MDCIRLIRSEHQRLESRKVSPAFHLTVIEEALYFLASRLKGEDGPLKQEDHSEMSAACTEALEAVADLRTSRLLLP